MSTNRPETILRAEQIARLLIGTVSLALAVGGQFALRATPDGLGLGWLLSMAAIRIFSIIRGKVARDTQWRHLA